MNVRDLVASMSGVEVRGQVDLDAPVMSVAFDSRQAGPGVVFVALVGANADGHTYIDRVRAAGASVVVAQADHEVDNCLVVPDTRAALPGIASAVYQAPSSQMQVVGITGTNGKTTSSYMLEGVLSRLGRRVGVLGTVNYRWPEHEEPAANTTPESAVIQGLLRRMKTAQVDTAVMEVSSHGLATHRVEQTLFDVVMFTNLTQDHLDFHGTMAAYREAKARLFTHHVRASLAAGKHPVAVVNIDDPVGEAFAAEAASAGARVVRVGTGDQADLRASDVRFDVRGTTFRVSGEMLGQSVDAQVFTPVLGQFNVENLLGVMAAALSLGALVDEVVRAVGDVLAPPGRLERALSKPDTFVDYAHTPDALQRVLETVRPLTSGRLVVVCGCGGDRDRDKRPLMAAAASRIADVVVLTSDNPRFEDPEKILDDMVPGLTIPLTQDFPAHQGALRVTDREQAIAEALRHAGPDDVVVIAGKGHETYQEIRGERRDFSDVAVARRLGEP